jgi:hypothetical protein
MRYDVPIEFDIVAMAEPGNRGSELRVRMNAIPVGENRNVTWHAGVGLWANHYRYHLEHTACGEPDVLNLATEQLLTEGRAHFKVHCMMQNLENAGFVVVKRA